MSTERQTFSFGSLFDSPAPEGISPFGDLGDANLIFTPTRGFDSDDGYDPLAGVFTPSERFGAGAGLGPQIPDLAGDLPNPPHPSAMDDAEGVYSEHAPSVAPGQRRAKKRGSNSAGKASGKIRRVGASGHSDADHLLDLTDEFCIGKDDKVMCSQEYVASDDLTTTSRVHVGAYAQVLAKSQDGETAGDSHCCPHVSLFNMLCLTTNAPLELYDERIVHKVNAPSEILTHSDGAVIDKTFLDLSTSLC